MRGRGIIEVLLSGLCFGFLGYFGKWAYEDSIHPFELLALRFSIGGLILFFSLSWWRKRWALPRRSEWLSCLILGAGGYAVFSSFYFLALEGISASLTVLLLYLYPSFVVLGGALFFKERPQKNLWFIVPGLLVGMICLVGLDVEVANLPYLGFGFGSALVYSFYILLSKRLLNKRDSLLSSAWIQIFAGAGLMVVGRVSPHRVQEIFTESWLLIILIAVICSVAAMTLFLSSLQKLQAWEVSILSMVELISGVLIGMILLGDVLNFWQFIGTVILLGILIYVSLPPGRISRTH